MSFTIAAAAAAALAAAVCMHCDLCAFARRGWAMLVRAMRADILAKGGFGTLCGRNVRPKADARAVVPNAATVAGDHERSSVPWPLAEAVCRRGRLHLFVLLRAGLAPPLTRSGCLHLCDAYAVAVEPDFAVVAREHEPVNIRFLALAKLPGPVGTVEFCALTLDVLGAAFALCFLAWR